MKVLLIDDDPDIAETVGLAFELRWPNARVAVAQNGNAGLDMLESEDPQIVLLDVGLPDINGLQVLKHIRSVSNVPVIVLTVKDAETDVAWALDMGADDYVTKPFSHLVLLARVQAVLRRSMQPRRHAISSGDVVISTHSRRVTVDGRSVALDSTEFDLLVELMNNRGKTLASDDLLSRVWGPKFTWAKDSLDIYIDILRQKLGDSPRQPRMILGHRDEGYTFMGTS
ncbi:MAG: response regulator transcription factor [Chloroflexi bacterium]|nr:response regulator transcription factor [Chloroflexota bacterium]